jgi:hypothetical protein
MFFGVDEVFEQRLRRDATRARLDAAPESGLELRILQAVAASARPVRARRSKAHGWTLLGIAAVAGAACVLIFTQGPASHPREKTAPGSRIEIAGTPAAEQTQGDRTEVAVAAASSSRDAPDEAGWWTSLDARQSALTLAAKNPLQHEIDSVYTDAQAVIGFLALNFLPTNPERSQRPDATAEGGARRG